MPGDPSPGKHAASATAAVERTRKDAAFQVQAPRRPHRWYLLARASLKLAAYAYSSIQVEGRERIPPGPVLYCFSHQSWIDPMYVMAVLPRSPRIYFFGPQEDDMRRGIRNRLMRWFGLVIPFAPGARGLLAATHRTVDLTSAGASIAIAGEGRIHCGESCLLPLKDGAAYIALRAGVPLVPMAINGTSWLGFRRRIRVRFGEPIAPAQATAGRPDADGVVALTAKASESLLNLVADFGDRRPPGPVGRWLTELFNEWPGGERPTARTTPPSPTRGS
jgi:1-acyl-sn-glycerol-3-phosphate acyltransferase